jgi:hypothetical protein
MVYRMSDAFGAYVYTGTTTLTSAKRLSSPRQPSFGNFGSLNNYCDGQQSPAVFSVPDTQSGRTVEVSLSLTESGNTWDFRESFNVVMCRANFAGGISSNLIFDVAQLLWSVESQSGQDALGVQVNQGGTVSRVLDHLTLSCADPFQPFRT